MYVNKELNAEFLCSSHTFFEVGPICYLIWHNNFSDLSFMNLLHYFNVTSPKTWQREIIFISVTHLFHNMRTVIFLNCHLTRSTTQANNKTVSKR